jgi:hypothetical protein
MFAATAAWMFCTLFSFSQNQGGLVAILLPGLFFGLPLYFGCGIYWELLAKGPDGIGERAALTRVVAVEAGIIVGLWIVSRAIF